MTMRVSAVIALLMSWHAVNAQAASTDVHDLPLNWTAPKEPRTPFVAVLMTGDGGFADLVTKVANRLAEQGVGVVGFNSHAWLGQKRTPTETAAAVGRALRAAREKFGADSVVIVGFSRGADFAPFVANRLPADLRRRLAAVVMLGIAPAASFEFHLTDLVKSTKRDSDIPTMPELEKLRGTPMACVYGSDEKESGCRGAPPSLMKVEERDGGHHFDGDPTGLADVVLRLIKRLPQK